VGFPAAKQNDRVTGMCTHLVPGPGAGAPQPTPLPYSGPLIEGLATNVMVAGAPAAVVGSVAYCNPPHVGIVDAFAAPPTQRATVLDGSTTVLIGGKPAARTGSNCSTCAGTGTLAGSAATVLIGG
jgi:uncharacterized Zn-binding protein involved in type VI secretion